MTIPEASMLVLQSAAQGNGGEIFVLDMGQPVKIVNLARQMIELSGLKPDEDIKIEFTGLRPGEKLFEELNCKGENFVPTGHPTIFRFDSCPEDVAHLRKLLERLRFSIHKLNAHEVRMLLVSMVPDYEPKGRFVPTTVPRLQGDFEFVTKKTNGRSPGVAHGAD